MMSTKYVVLLFTSFIYVLVLVGFNKAKNGMQGPTTQNVVQSFNEYMDKTVPCLTDDEYVVKEVIE